MATKEQADVKKRKAYILYKQGTAIPDIGKMLHVSDRMVYRYIQEFELAMLRKWKKTFEEALKVTDVNAPVSQLLKVIQAKN